MKKLVPLAIARQKGKPHLFVTITCNPRPPYILKALVHGEKLEDPPDIMLRVFRQQLLQLGELLIEGGVPGWEKAKGIIVVVEFQKRGK